MLVAVNWLHASFSRIRKRAFREAVEALIKSKESAGWFLERKRDF